MAHDNRRRQDIILILAAEGARRDDLARALRKEGFKPTFIGVLDTVMDLLASLRPATLLHDWPTVEPTQAVTFHQRLGKSPSHVDMCRILYLPTLSPQAAALATDSGIRRLIPHSTSATAMASEIRMALSSLSNLPELQVRMLELSAGKKYDQALIDGEVEKAYKIFPHEPGVRLEFGLLCLRNRRVQIARVLAEDLVAENVQNVRAMNLLARTLMADGKADQASELLERANMLSPFNPERLVLLGDAFFSVGKNEKAAAYYTKAMAVDQHDHDAKAGLARVKLKDGDVNAALEIINSGLSEEEGVSLFNNAAVRAAQTGQLEVSLKLYESALKAVKSSTLKATVQFNIALAYERLGRLEEAGAALARCMKLAPTFDKGKQLQKRLSRRAAS